MMKIEDLKVGDEVRNTKTGSVGVIRPNLRPFSNPNIGWVEVQVTKSANGKQFTSFWSLRNIELIKPK